MRRLRRHWRRLISAQMTDKAKALTRYRAQEALIPAGVLDRLPHRIDAARQCRFRDDTTILNFVEQLILADDAIAVLKEIQQRFETCASGETSSPALPRSRRSTSNT
jgi:hypothetical protein